jgi:hypothetical protein
MTINIIEVQEIGLILESIYFLRLLLKEDIKINRKETGCENIYLCTAVLYFNEILWKFLNELCACLNMENEKYILSFCLELVKVDGCDFLHLCDGPMNSHPFFKQPLVHNEFDVTHLHLPSYLTSVMYIAASTECNITKY